MSKTGKVLGQVTESMMQAGGVATKKSGEALSGLGKEMYYKGETAGRKVETVTNKLENEAKETYYSMKDKMKH